VEIGRRRVDVDELERRAAAVAGAAATIATAASIGKYRMLSLRGWCANAARERVLSVPRSCQVCGVISRA